MPSEMVYRHQKWWHHWHTFTQKWNVNNHTVLILITVMNVKKHCSWFLSSRKFLDVISFFQDFYKIWQTFTIFPCLPVRYRCTLIFPGLPGGLGTQFEQISNVGCKHLSHILRENLFASSDILNHSNSYVVKHHCAIFNSYWPLILSVNWGCFRNTEPKIDRLGTDVYSQTNGTLSPWWPENSQRFPF